MDFDPLEQIRLHSTALYDVAGRDLAARVEHCPDWDVADLVHHLTSVHWFWATVVETLPSEPPEARWERVPDDELIDAGRQQLARLLEALRTTDTTAACWTWCAPQQHVGFILRHQVQEAAVHHFDAAHAVGASWDVDEEVAADAVDEMLHVSLPSEHDPADPPPAPLGEVVLSTGTRSWTVRDAGPGALVVTPGGGPPTVQAPAKDLLLWLYNRKQLDVPDLARAFLTWGD